MIRDMLLLGFASALSLSACSSDDDSSGSGGAATGGSGGATGGTGGSATGGAAGSSTGGAAGSATGGAAGTSGDGGACKKCSEMIATAEADLKKACAGSSATLIKAFVDCTCLPANCGGTGKGCEQECKGATPISTACQQCDTQMAAGACHNEFGACMADT